MQTYGERLTGIHWTGLNDRDTEGQYVWADGTPAQDELL